MFIFQEQKISLDDAQDGLLEDHENVCCEIYNLIINQLVFFKTIRKVYM